MTRLVIDNIIVKSLKGFLLIVIGSLVAIL